MALRKSEQALLKHLQENGYTVYVADESGVGGRRSVLKCGTHDDLFYGTAAEREAFYRGMLAAANFFKK